MLDDSKPPTNSGSVRREDFTHLRLTARCKRRWTRSGSCLETWCSWRQRPVDCPLYPTKTEIWICLISEITPWARYTDPLQLHRALSALERRSCDVLPVHRPHQKTVNIEYKYKKILQICCNTSYICYYLIIILNYNYLFNYNSHWAERCWFNHGHFSDWIGYFGRLKYCNCNEILLYIIYSICQYLLVQNLPLSYKEYHPEVQPQTIT